MANVAATRIVHGNDDGTRTVIEQGEPIKGLDNETVKALKESGAIVPEKELATASGVEEEKRALEERIAALEAELEAARNSQPAGEQKPGHPATGGSGAANPAKDK